MIHFHKSSLAAALLAPLLLVACSDGTEVVVREGNAAGNPAEDTCGASMYQKYVGEKSPVINLPAGTEFRHFRTGDPVTMDMSPARVNFEYDRSGNLVKVFCG